MTSVFLLLIFNYTNRFIALTVHYDRLYSNQHTTEYLSVPKYTLCTDTLYNNIMHMYIYMDSTDVTMF